MTTTSSQKKPHSRGSTMPGLSHWPDIGACCRRNKSRQASALALEGGNYKERRKRIVYMQTALTNHYDTYIYHKQQRIRDSKRVIEELRDSIKTTLKLPPRAASNIFQTRCCLSLLILTAVLTTTCCIALERPDSGANLTAQSTAAKHGVDAVIANEVQREGGSSYLTNGQHQFKNQSISEFERGGVQPSVSTKKNTGNDSVAPIDERQNTLARPSINNDEPASQPLGSSSRPSLPSSKVRILENATAVAKVVVDQFAQRLRDNNQARPQLAMSRSGSGNQLDKPAYNDDDIVSQSTQLAPSTTTELSPFVASASSQGEVLVAADSKKKKKMMKKKKKMEKKHKEWKKGKKHKKKKYESKKKKGGMSKKKKGKKEKKKWGMEKKGHKKKGNFKKKKWGHKKKMKKGHKKGKKGHKMLKDKGHKKKGFKKVYHKEEWGKKKKWHDIKREKKWNTKQKKWKKKWHQEKGKKYKGKHMKKYHKKNKHGKKYKKEKKSKWKKHKGEKYKKGHKKKKEEYSKKKEGGKKKKMKKMKKEMKKKKGG